MTKLSEEDVESIRKVKELAIYREEYIREKGKPPLFKPASEKIGISSNTVHRLAPDLFLMWYDEGFHSDFPHLTD